MCLQGTEKCLCAAVPLVKLDHLLEENRYRLSDRHHMSNLITLVALQEQEDIKKEVSGRPSVTSVQ